MRGWWRVMRKGPAIVICLVACSACTYASVATVNLDWLAKNSEEIVLVNVTSVTHRSGVRVGVAQVVQAVVGKLQKGTEIEFVAERTWTCDVSNAVVGERLLLLLRHVPDSARATMNGQELGRAAKATKIAGRQLFTIAHSGRGRIVLIGESKDVWSAKVSRFSNEDSWHFVVNLNVSKPMKVKAVDAKNGRVTLSELLTCIKKAMASPKNAAG